MSVTLTDAQYGVVMNTMREAATGYTVRSDGGVKRLNRTEIQEAARRACEFLGWSYGIKSTLGRGETSGS